MSIKYAQHFFALQILLNGSPVHVPKKNLLSESFRTRFSLEENATGHSISSALETNLTPNLLLQSVKLVIGPPLLLFLLRVQWWSLHITSWLIIQIRFRRGCRNALSRFVGLNHATLMENGSAIQKNAFFFGEEFMIIAGLITCEGMGVLPMKRSSWRWLAWGWRSPWKKIRLKWGKSRQRKSARAKSNAQMLCTVWHCSMRWVAKTQRAKLHVVLQPSGPSATYLCGWVLVMTTTGQETLTRNSD